MVANHAHKKLARQLMANSQYPMSYTTAMDHAARIVHDAKLESLRGISSVELSANDRAVIAQAAVSLAGGSDLVIFGLAGTGKSTAAYSVLEAAQLRSLLLTSNYLEAAYLRSYLQNIDTFVQAQHLFAGLPEKFDPEAILVDELRNSFAAQGAQLSTAERRVIVLHGSTVENAQQRLGRMLPELELRSPVFLEAIYDQTLRTRRLIVHRNAPIGSDPISDSIATAFSVAGLKSITLTASRDGSDEILGSATELKDIIILLRFAQLAMGKRYRELIAAEGTAPSEDYDHTPLTVIVEEEAGSIIRDNSYALAEAGQILADIARSGASSAVHLTVNGQDSE